jgi:hypothetical protein
VAFFISSKTTLRASLVGPGADHIPLLFDRFGFPMDERVFGFRDVAIRNRFANFLQLVSAVFSKFNMDYGIDQRPQNECRVGFNFMSILVGNDRESKFSFARSAAS